VQQKYIYHCLLSFSCSRTVLTPLMNYGMYNMYEYDKPKLCLDITDEFITSERICQQAQLTV